MENEEESLNEEEIEKAVENEDESQEDSSLPTTPFEGEVKKAKAVASKKILQLLLKHPMTWVVLGVIFIILFAAILIFAMDFDMFGKGIIRPTYYDTKCGKILLTWERSEYYEAHKNDDDYEPITDPALVDLEYEDSNHIKRWEYKEVDYDTYITNVIWTDNEKAGIVENQTVYEAMSVAARSFLVSKLPSNCVVLRDYNPQSYTELDGSEDNYQDINSAVKATKGLIIGREGTIISALYDPFSYVYKRPDGNEQEHFYHMMQANNEEQQRIPANWVDQHKNIPITKVLTIKKFESMSLYGAKYLQEHEDYDYDIYRLLEYYYGTDIEYYTIDYISSDDYNPDPECSEISMKKTTLDRDTFISLVEKYAASKNISGLNTLAANAGMIYDMSVSQGINPELVFIRADVEGYSPGASKNNYWGLGCTNTGGYDACITYGSLSEGVAGFLKYISKFNTLLDLVAKYAYLGDYWYNPGSWGLGGCPYASSIYNPVPERVKEACKTGRICNADGSGDCVPTTDEDKKAYLVFQSKSMLKARKNIFNLDADICETDYPIGEDGEGNCTIWRQGDSRWGSIKLGSSSATMAGSGCAVTSVAIAMSCSGTTIKNVATFNPGTLVKELNNNGGFTDRGGIYWANKAIKNLAPAFTYFTTEKLLNKSNTEKLEVLKKNMKSNQILIVHIANLDHPRGHYTVLKSVTSNKMTVYDPANGKVNTYDIKDLDQIVVYKY